MPPVTHRNEVPDTGPETIVWQLSPSTSIFHIPVVEDTSSKVDDDGDDDDNCKDAAGAHASWLVGFHTGTGMLRAHDKQVGAFVWVGADKGNSSGGADGVAVASESEGGGFPARVVFLDGHGVEGACVAFAVAAIGRGGGG